MAALRCCCWGFCNFFLYLLILHRTAAPAAAADPGSGCTDWPFIDERWVLHNNGAIDLSRTLTRSLDNVPKKHRAKWARCVDVAADALRDAALDAASHTRAPTAELPGAAAAELAALCDDDAFVRAFGADKSELPALIKHNAVTLERLLAIYRAMQPEARGPPKARWSF